MSVCPKCQELQPDEALRCSECDARMLPPAPYVRPKLLSYQQLERVGLAEIGLCVACDRPILSVTGTVEGMRCARCDGFETDGRVDHAAWVAARRGAA